MTKYTMATRPRSFHMTTATKTMLIEKIVAALCDERTGYSDGKRILRTATIERLIEIHEMLSLMISDNQDPLSEEFIARFWVEGELEDRDFGAYYSWQDYGEPGVSPRKYFLESWRFEEIW